MKFIIFVFMVAVAVLAIAIENKRASGELSVTTTYHQTLQRFHDDEMDVTCWGREGYGHTLSCLPDWMLMPQKVKP